MAVLYLLDYGGLLFDGLELRLERRPLPRLLLADLRVEKSLPQGKEEGRGVITRRKGAITRRRDLRVEESLPKRRGGVINSEGEEGQ